MRQCVVVGSRRVVFLSLSLMASACSRLGPPDGGPLHTTTQPTQAAVTNPPGSATPCVASQLRIELGNIQGATGNFVATFWVADGSRHECLLESPAVLELLNTAGTVQLSATQSFSAIALNADTALPLDNTITTGGLAYISLEWPTDANAALAQGSTSGSCPSADFVPSAAQLSFGSSGGVAVTQLHSGSSPISICGQHITLGIGPVQSTPVPPPRPPLTPTTA